MVRLREEARARLGDRFDLKNYHDAVLLNGDMPLEVPATVVQDWDLGADGLTRGQSQGTVTFTLPVPRPRTAAR